jgi:hypothetical protein
VGESSLIWIYVALAVLVIAGVTILLGTGHK